MARRQPALGHDPSRREFFRTFSRQTVKSAGAVAGAAAELRRTSVAAARELLELDATNHAVDERRTVVTPAQPAATPDETFRSAYRFTGDAIVVLDQRELPSRVLTYACADAGEAAAAIRAGAVTPGPVVAEVGAYAMALAARGAVDRSDASREQRVRAAAGALRSARREVAVLAAAVDRMEARYDALAAGRADPSSIASALTDEADAIANEAMLANAAIGRYLGATLRESARAEDGQLHVLVHGDAGPLSWGTVGPGTAAFQALLNDGAPLHVWVTHGAPSDEGLRITAHSLTQLDVPHTLIPDTAVAWLLSNRAVACALLRADTILRSGELVAPIGSRSVATLAPVLALRSAAEATMGARHARLQPTSELVPSSVISTVLTESEQPA